jgi:hypothetical protein
MKMPPLLCIGMARLGASFPARNVTPEVDNTLFGVTAVATNDVWAVGTQQPTSLTDPHTLILHWNGAAWSIVPSPNDGGNNVGNHLRGCRRQCRPTMSGRSVFRSLEPSSEHWNGSAWSVVPTPEIANTEPLFLPGVVALSSNNVWSVGGVISIPPESISHLDRAMERNAMDRGEKSKCRLGSQ